MINMLFKGHSTRLEMLIEKIHSNKENAYQDSESTASEIPSIGTGNLQELPKSSESLSDTEEEKDWHELRKNDSDDILKSECCDGDYFVGKGSEINFLQFSCSFCPRQFKHKRSRDRHIKLHTGDKKYKCILCESAFARSDHLNIHMKTHDVKKQYRCFRCNKSYNTFSAFSFHERNHKDPFFKKHNFATKLVLNTEDCDVTEYSQRPPSLIAISQEVDSEEQDIKTICVYCFQWFSNIEVMRNHIEICRRNSDDKKKLSSAVTRNSQELFGSLKELNAGVPNKESTLKKLDCEDVLMSQETFICSCCYDRFPNFKSFLVHMETHVSSSKNCNVETNDEFYLSRPPMVSLPNYACCCRCNAIFESSEKLEDHLIEQHIITSYKCSLCEQSFEDIPSMKIHLTSTHINNGEHFECNCSELPKLFHDRSSAQLHFSKYHTNMSCVKHSCKVSLEASSPNFNYFEKVSKNCHQCIYCKEYCKTKNDLQLHLKSHQIFDKSRHKCNICDETFGSSCELASHKLIHCKIVEGNICVQCKAILMNEESFIMHQLKHNDNSKSVGKMNLVRLSICIICGQTLQSDKEIELHAKFHLKFLSQHKNSPVINSPNIKDATFPLNKETTNLDALTFDATLELQCHLCKKSFMAKEELQIHLIEHNFFGINQFSCYVCSAVFTGAAGLQSHLIAHNLSEKPYQCSRCSAGFYFRTELDNHKYIHNFNMQYDCLSEESISSGRHFTNGTY